jgi:tetratricopeptide (TPR) repeat protein
VIEDTMFFPRLRHQAKWVFLFLAIVFGLGFVGFGVGAGGIGLGNIFEGVADSGIPSVSEAEKRTAENPRDPAAFRALADAHVADGNTDEAIEALERLVQLRPRNVDALRELAGLYLSKADEAQTAANEANLRAAYLAPGNVVSSTILLDDRPLDPDPISSALSTRLSNIVSTKLGEAQQASASAVTAYEKIVAATPRDPSVLLELGQAAENAGDTAKAIEAYEKFVRRAPNDPATPEVKRLLEELRASAPPPSG